MTLILIVDDVPAMAEQYAYDLKRLRGYETLIAKSGRSALESLTRDSVDCVILDIEMPGMDGFEVLRSVERLGLRVPIIVYTTLIIPNNILFEAALSFLGIGVPQETPSWGRQLSDAGSIFTVAWWMMLFPGLFLFFTTLAFNLVGDGLRDALDPRTGG